MHATDTLVVQLARAQCGAFARWQLRPYGVPDDFIWYRVHTGAWNLAVPGVYTLPGVAPSYEQRLWIAWLAVGLDAIISFEAAAQVHGIPNVIRDRVTLTCAHGWHHRIPGVFVHQINDVLTTHRAEVEGLPITTIPRTIVDLAVVVHPARLHSIVEDSKHARLTTYPAIGQCMASVARRGKPGIGKLVRVLDHLTSHHAVEGSKLERALFDVLRNAHLPLPVGQFPFPGRQFVNGCVDCAYLEAMLILEADGRSWHTRIRELKRDHERDAEAARHGWQTLRLLHENIVGDPEGTAATVRDVLAQRLAQLVRAT